MVRRVGKPSTATRAAIACAIARRCWRAADRASAAVISAAPAPTSLRRRSVSEQPARRPCSSALGDIATRVYREGVASERTGSALNFIDALDPAARSRRTR